MDDLREWDYGDYEGLTTAEIQKRVPGWTIFTGAVPNGETAEQVGARADRVIARALAGKRRRRVVRARPLVAGAGGAMDRPRSCERTAAGALHGIAERARI